MSSSTASLSRPAVDAAVLLWALPFVYAMHIIEEAQFGWAIWAQQMGLAFTWTDFAVANAGVMIFGICTAAIGYRMPAIGLSYAALMLINGAVFHLVPTVLLDRPNPGFITAVLLFLPLGVKVMADARAREVPVKAFVGAFGLAAAAQAFPFMLLALRPSMAWH